MARKKKRGRRRTSNRACVVKSGRKKGKLKKGWRFGKNGRCIRAKGRR